MRAAFSELLKTLKILGCCLLAICCPPAAQRAALTAVLKAWSAENPDAETLTVDKAGTITGGVESYFAERLLAEVDLAPLGLTEAVKGAWGGTDAELGAAVRAVYAPAFAEAAQGGAPAPEPGAPAGTGPELDRGGAA